MVERQGGGGLLDRTIDLSFRHYVTPHLVRYLYVLSLLVGALIAAGIGLLGRAALPGLGGAFAAVGLAAGIVFVMIGRIACEIALSLFRAAGIPAAAPHPRQQPRRLTADAGEPSPQDDLDNIASAAAER